MKKDNITLTSAEHTLSGVYWQAENPVAITLLVHGFGEHVSRYDHVAQQFLDNNISVIGVDLIGHGNSTGKRGVINSMEDFFGCLDSLLKYVEQEASGLPRILYGHSMGGNIVLNYLIKTAGKDFCCAMATSPWLKLSKRPSAFKLFLAKTMNVIYPSLQQPAGLDIEDISSVVEVQNDYLNDPLNHDTISVRLANEIMDNGLHAIASASTLNLPLLLAHGDADAITSPKASESFSDACTTATLKIWPGLRHETHNEHNQNEVIAFYVKWVADHLAMK